MYSHIFDIRRFYLSDNHDLSIADLINIYGAQEVNIGRIDSTQDPSMHTSEHLSHALMTNQDPLLSSPSATVFLHFILNGGGGCLDPGVEAEILAAKEALANVGISWVELLATLKDETQNTEDVT